MWCFVTLGYRAGCHFFTVALAERRCRLLTENIQRLRTAFRQVMADHPFSMEAVVILPDHLHYIWTFPRVTTISPPAGDRSKRLFLANCPRWNAVPKGNRLRISEQ
jgi:REP element-mobilizing transposase RayT